MWYGLKSQTLPFGQLNALSLKRHQSRNTRHLRLVQRRQSAALFCDGHEISHDNCSGRLASGSSSYCPVARHRVMAGFLAGLPYWMTSQGGGAYP